MLAKRICLSSAIALAAQFALADYLYCIVGNGEGKATYSYNGESFDYSFVTIVMLPSTGEDRSDYLDFYAGGAATSIGSAMSSNSKEPLYAELPNDYEDQQYNTFLFELWTQNGSEFTKTAWQRYSLAQVADNIVRSGSPSGGSPLAVTSVIPEPTGGVLMLLGMAVLAVRRKNMKDSN